MSSEVLFHSQVRIGWCGADLAGVFLSFLFYCFLWRHLASNGLGLEHMHSRSLGSGRKVVLITQNVGLAM